MKTIELSSEMKTEYISSLYECFNTGRNFEIFLNYFLQKIGFEEVVTTKYVGDKGIDLTCIKRGIDVSGIDTINYYIQAKRYKPANKVSSSEIRDLKGSTKYDKNGNILNNNYINVMITTSSFTRGAVEEASVNRNNPTILIDGEKLIDMCIEHSIGFAFTPVFSKEEIIKLCSGNENKVVAENLLFSNSNDDYLVQREITANDIRARILIIPQLIKNAISSSSKYLEVNINSEDYKLNIDKSHRYLGGITEVYRKCGLIEEDGVFISKTAKWKILNDRIYLVIE